MSLSFWIVIGALVYNPSYEKLGFPDQFANCSIFKNSSTTNYLEGYTRIYSLSYMYYLPLGVFLTVIFGLLGSILTGGLKMKSVNSSLYIFDLTKKFKKISNNKIEDVKMDDLEHF